jgi:protoheme IX farnesyltransferase
MIKKFIYLTKPGIIFGNLVSVLGGFFLAAQGNIDLWLLLVVLVGTSLVVASGCVVNNIIDQDIDQKMERTKNRALVKKTISNNIAFFYAAVLGFLGFAALYIWTNLLAVAFAAIGFIVYAGWYSLYLKRHSVHQTIIGSISGACPPVIGYCAARNGIDAGALILFILFCFWQMPHSFGIAIYRLQDYTAANIPILPVKKGIKPTKIQSVIYILLFSVAGIALYAFDYVGIIYLVIFIALCLYWLSLAIKGFQAKNDQLWAKKFFLFSVILISIFSLTISLDYTDTQHPIYTLSML